MIGKAGAVVSHLNTKRLLRRSALISIRPGVERGAIPWRICILNDGLQDEVGHFRIKRLVSHVDAGNQTVLKTDAFDVQVTTEESYFLFQRYFLRTVAV